MNRDEGLFLHILRSVLWGDEKGKDSMPPDLHTTDVDWSRVLALANRQSCAHAFGVWILQNHIDTPYNQSLRANVFLSLQRQSRLNQLAAEVVTLLQNHGIQAVLMKGYGLAVLYPDADMRSFGDVDIYVGEKEYLHAAKILTDAFPDNYWHSDLYGGIHYILCLDNQCDRTIELHRVTMEFADRVGNRVFQTYTEHCMAEPLPVVSVCGVDVSLPRASYNALYVFLHAWHHFESTGVGFRQLGDWALAVHHAYRQATPQEWNEAVNEMKTVLDALHLTNAWQTFGYVLVHTLGLPREEFPLYTECYRHRAQRLTVQLMRDGHGYRPAHNRLSEITLMRRFPWKRPEACRVLQIIYTVCRLFFDAWQMGKFFPHYAWVELRANLRHAVTKRQSRTKICQN